jgi:hypothetical protein
LESSWGAFGELFGKLRVYFSSKNLECYDVGKQTEVSQREFEVSHSKNKKFVQPSCFQKAWKIALLSLFSAHESITKV